MLLEVLLEDVAGQAVITRYEATTPTDATLQSYTVKGFRPQGILKGEKEPEHLSSFARCFFV
jgi:hypothetical protein